MTHLRFDHRERGAYYTPAAVAEYMAAWILTHNVAAVLEPSSGDGAFLRAIETTAAHLSRAVPRMTAVELSLDAIRSASASLRSDNVEFVHADFMDHSESTYDAAIGNPPFVRLRHLSAPERVKAISVAERILAQPMDPAGSVWMPFLLHATRRLRVDGCLTMVLPLDVTFVRYARPLWRFLSQSYGGLRVVRVRERLFPELSQDVVLLFADHAGSSTEAVQFEAFSSVARLTAGSADVRKDVAVKDIVVGERAFLRALLQPELCELLEHELDARLEPIGKSVRLRIGYVAGDKSFFHPTRETIRDYALRRRSLVPAIASARGLRGGGLFTSGIAPERTEQLFLPHSTSFQDGEAAYIRHGVRSGVSKGYKCRVRTPWFIVPYVAPPDLILSVFSDRPLLAVNDAGLSVSNSFLCGTLLAHDARTLACRWYNSLTLLECELNVHSLGGGVFVMVPREAAAVRLLRDLPKSQKLVNQIDRALKSGDVTQAYNAGDRALTVGITGLTASQLELVREGVETLRMWRNPAPRRGGSLVEEVDEELSLLEA